MSITIMLQTTLYRNDGSQNLRSFIHSPVSSKMSIFLSARPVPCQSSRPYLLCLGNPIYTKINFLISTYFIAHHSKLETFYLFHKFFPPQTFLVSTGLSSRTFDTALSVFLFSLFSFILFSVWLRAV